MEHITTLLQSQLGKKSSYESFYNPRLLFPVPRQTNRAHLSIEKTFPFYGYDLWNHYEVSWLNHKGKPQIATAQIVYDAYSENIIESKSLKLYFNSFNMTLLDSKKDLAEIIQRDLSLCVGSEVKIHIDTDFHTNKSNFVSWPDKSICLDELDLEIDTYHPEPQFLTTDSNIIIEEKIYSHLLKSNCPVTGQPDWGSVFIAYKGNKISHEGLLKFIISLRQYDEFHEHCIERLFMEIWNRCQPSFLEIRGNYVRRGGLDINPFRTSNANFEHLMLPCYTTRLWRQ